MADGSNIGYFPAMSRLIGEVDSPTNTQPMTSPQFGGSPEQLMSMMQSPHMQQLLQQWGVNFDPSQIRQSPFLPNSIMQQHPMFGRGFTGAASAMAATPEAPLVSGAGSGMSRAMQGLMGGNELQRQYQVRQLMAPMQMVGQQMPAAEFQRKQQLLELLGQDLNARESQAQAALAQKAQEDLQKQQFNLNKSLATRPYTDPGSGLLMTYQEGQGQQPPQQGLQPGLGGMPAPEGAMPTPGALPTQGAVGPGMPPLSPGFHPAPPGEQPTMEQRQAYTNATHPERAAYAAEKNALVAAGMPQAQAEYYSARAAQATNESEYRAALVEAGLPEAQAEYYAARGFEARQKGNQAQSNPKPGGKDQAYWQKRYQDLEDKISSQIRTLEGYIANPQTKPDQKALYQQQIDQLNMQREQEKAKIDAARGAAGASVPFRPESRYKDPNAPKGNPLNPNASQGSAQAGGAGSQINENTAPAPNPYGTPTPPPAPQNPY